eukprot:1303975-Prorocentrum_lima.AAC.1
MGRLLATARRGGQSTESYAFVMSSLATTRGSEYDQDLWTSRKRSPCISCARRPGTKPIVRSASPP